MGKARCPGCGFTGNLSATRAHMVDCAAYRDYWLSGGRDDPETDYQNRRDYFMDMIGMADRGQSRKAKNEQRLQELFAGRHFRVLMRIDLPNGQYFKTPLGARSRKGYLLGEVGNEDANHISVPDSMYDQIKKHYNAIEEG